MTTAIDSQPESVLIDLASMDLEGLAQLLAACREQAPRLEADIANAKAAADRAYQNGNIAAIRENWARRDALTARLDQTKAQMASVESRMAELTEPLVAEFNGRARAAVEPVSRERRELSVRLQEAAQEVERVLTALEAAPRKLNGVIDATQQEFEALRKRCSPYQPVGVRFPDTNEIAPVDLSGTVRILSACLDRLAQIGR